MKVISLISGGKDSIFHMLECVRHGHELVALANLQPPETSIEDMDSWCFQTVGHGVIEAVAECLELPLFRVKIRGGLVNSQLAYSESKDDEVEDMYELLLKAKTAMPDIQAVGCGAILSTYQRTRVENVCQRLGLTSLAYLWQRDQVELLQEMVDSGMEAIIIKVAAMGLSPSTHLGKTIKELAPFLIDAQKKFGCNPCGEGGEYESFTLDCPLYKKKIVLQKTELCGDLVTKIAPVGNLLLREWRVVEKEYSSSEEKKNIYLALRQQFLQEKEQQQTSLISSSTLENLSAVSEREREFCFDLRKKLEQRERSSMKVVHARAANVSGELVFVASCSLASTENNNEKEDAEEDIGDAVTTELHRLLKELQRENMGLEHMFYSQLMLKDLSHFGIANFAYSKVLPQKNSPSRTCIEYASSFSSSPSVLADCFAYRDVSKREVLHVQSISKWAPACIGPYSQVSQFGGLLFLAGQIGLDPPSMTLVQNSKAQALQTQYNCEQVLKARNSSLAQSLMLCVFTTPGHANLGPQLAKSCGLAQETVLYIEVPALPRDACVEMQLVCFVSDMARRFEDCKTSYVVRSGSTAFKVLSRSVELNSCFLNCVVSLHSKQCHLIQESDFVEALEQVALIFVKKAIVFWNSLWVLRVYYLANVGDRVIFEFFRALASVLEREGLGICPAISFVPVSGFPSKTFSILSLHAIFLDLAKLHTNSEDSDFE